MPQLLEPQAPHDQVWFLNQVEFIRIDWRGEFKIRGAPTRDAELIGKAWLEWGQAYANDVRMIMTKICPHCYKTFTSAGVQ